MISEVFKRLDEIASALPPERWMLVGGLMVHAHALSRHRPAGHWQDCVLIGVDTPPDESDGAVLVPQGGDLRRVDAAVGVE